MDQTPPDPEPSPPAGSSPGGHDRDRKTTPREWGLFALMIGGGLIAMTVVGTTFVANLATQMEAAERSRPDVTDLPAPDVAGFPPIEAQPPPPVVINPAPASTASASTASAESCDLPAITTDKLDVMTREAMARAPVRADPRTSNTDQQWIARPNAEFPQSAGRRGFRNGRVVLDCLTNAQGWVVGCAVAEEEPPDAGFGSAALEAMCDAQFNPRTVNGMARPSRITYTLRFQMAD